MPPRPAIPAAVQRQLMIDAGWQCSVPTCGVNSSLEIDHIEDWAVVHEHKYENLIVLCPTHHAMKRRSSNPRDLNSAALKQIKLNQLEMAGRYTDTERRVLEHFVRNPDERVVFLPGDFDILLMHILDAGLLEKEFNTDGSVVVTLSESDTEPTRTNSLTIRQAYALTNDGVDAVTALRGGLRLQTPLD